LENLTLAQGTAGYILDHFSPKLAILQPFEIFYSNEQTRTYPSDAGVFSSLCANKKIV